MKIKLLICLLIVAKLSIGQQYFFVLIENAEKQPFVVKVNNKVYTGNHFLTIPKLSKGAHELVIETSKKVSTIFLVTIDADDLGFVLKPSSDKGYVLFDINSFKTLNPAVREDKTIVKNDTPKNEEVKKDNPKQEEIKKEPIKVVETYPAIQQKKEVDDLPAPKKEDPKPTPTKIEEPKKDMPSTQDVLSNKTVTRKIYENASAKGVDQIYVIENGNKLDTVAIYIPQLTPSATTIIKETPKLAEPAPKVEVTLKAEDAPAKNTYANPNCTNLISTAFFEQILQAVNNESSDKAKLNKASSFFSKDCFSTNQVKQIGNLFKNDYYKFDFYRVSKKLILDLQNFPSLSETIKEEKVKEMFSDIINN